MGERHTLFEKWVWEWVKYLLEKLCMISILSKHRWHSSLHKPGNWVWEQSGKKDAPSLDQGGQGSRIGMLHKHILPVFLFPLPTSKEGWKHIWWPLFRGFVSGELKSHYPSRERLKCRTASDTKTPLKLQITGTPTTNLPTSCEDFCTKKYLLIITIWAPI